MPAAQLASAVIERLFNRLLQMDDRSAERLVPLRDKQLKVTLQELPWPLVFSFSDSVQVGSDDEQPVDCHISLSLAVLNQLSDSAVLTQLIQQKKLHLNGDMHVAQSFSELVKGLDIDWQHQLAQYTGDVFAHQAFSAVKRGQQSLKQNGSKLVQSLKVLVMEEKPLVAHPLAVQHFIDQVDQLRADTARLEARLTRFNRGHR